MNEVELENVDCPNLCVERSIKVLEGRDRLHNLPGVYGVYRCLGCGLERTTPRPTSNTMGYYYPSEYAPYKEKKIRKPRAGIKFFFAKLLGLYGKNLPSITPQRMLEFGCSSGSYMEYARSLGWVVDGIEFSEAASNIARNKGFKVQSGAIEQALPPGELYNLIVGWMVLEHVHQPVDVLKKLRKWIDPSGYLVISVPDRKSINRYIFSECSYDLQLPTHLFHFDKRSLTITLNNAGWNVEKFFWQRNCISFLMSLQIWADENKKKKLLKFAKWLKLSPKASKLRLIISLILGLTRQSGRMEIWAKPL